MGRRLADDQQLSKAFLLCIDRRNLMGNWCYDDG